MTPLKNAMMPLSGFLDQLYSHLNFRMTGLREFSVNYLITFLTRETNRDISCDIQVGEKAVHLLGKSSANSFTIFPYYTFNGTNTARKKKLSLE